MVKKNLTELFQFLRKVSLFKHISDDHINMLAKTLNLRKYNQGENIIQEGEGGTSIFFLLEGQVTITKKMTLLTDQSGKSQLDKTLIRLKHTDHAFFGEMAICGEGEVRSATVTAEKECILGELDADNIEKLVTSQPEFGMRFFQNLSGILADRLRKANRDILKLATALTLALEE
ncbi:MAG: cyclic nucleotide-binding domain-containing protein [bacterium]|nr:MAG: cyclic nucleotide-binding domain-containing protein [bacterium]